MINNTLPYRLAQKAKRSITPILTSNYQAWKLEGLIRVSQPAISEIGICFFAPMPDRFQRGGKVSASDFLPILCDELRKSSVSTFFASTNGALLKAIRQTERSVVVCIYKETDNTPKSKELLSILCEADLIFNHPASGAVLSNKLQANAVLSEIGCPIPRLADSLADDDLVFSNEVSNSGAPTFTAHKASELDESRYNTEFIDTAREYDGRRFYSTVRLMCLNDRILYQFLRLRDIEENDPSVHAKDTPKYPSMINALHKEILAEAAEQFEAIAKDVYKAFGPGFYSHDTLVDVVSGRAYICETGYKFNDMAYSSYMESIIHEIDGVKGHETAARSAASIAPVFLEVISEAFHKRG